MTFPSSQGDLSAQPGRTEEHGIRHLDPNNSILSLYPLTFCGFQIQLARFDHCTNIRDPICLNCVTPLPTKALTLPLLSRSLSPEEYLFLKLLSPWCSGSSFSNLNHIWLFPAYIPDLRLLLFCFAIFIWTFDTFRFASFMHFVKSIISAFQWSQRKQWSGTQKSQIYFLEMMLCGFRLAICLLWVWSIDWGEDFLALHQRIFCGKEVPIMMNLELSSKIFRGKLILNNELCVHHH